MNNSLEKRFWSKVCKIPSGCWIWIGALDIGGYGKIGEGGRGARTLKAHRVSATIHKLIDPDGKCFTLDNKYCVLHKNECHNRKCVNPTHLYIGNKRDNILDCVKHGSHNTTKLCSNEVKEVRRLYAEGWTQKALCHKFKVKRLQIYRIINYKQRIDI